LANEHAVTEHQNVHFGAREAVKCFRGFADDGFILVERGIEKESGPKKDGQMKRARFAEEQIIAVLKEHEAGVKTETSLASMAYPRELSTMERQIRRHGRFQGEAAEGLGRREREAEEASGRAVARCSRSSRAPFKKW
jgi:hypothetical protein